jgi:hypothetical protein
MPSSKLSSSRARSCPSALAALVSGNLLNRDFTTAVGAPVEGVRAAPCDALEPRPKDRARLCVRVRLVESARDRLPRGGDHVGGHLIEIGGAHPATAEPEVDRLGLSEQLGARGPAHETPREAPHVGHRSALTTPPSEAFTLPALGLMAEAGSVSGSRSSGGRTPAARRASTMIFKGPSASVQRRASGVIGERSMGLPRLQRGDSQRAEAIAVASVPRLFDRPRLAGRALRLFLGRCARPVALERLSGRLDSPQRCKSRQPPE